MLRSTKNICVQHSVCYLVIGIERVTFNFASPSFCTASERVKGRELLEGSNRRTIPYPNGTAFQAWDMFSVLYICAIFSVYWWFFLLKGLLLTNGIVILLVCIEDYKQVSYSSFTDKLPLWNLWNCADFERSVSFIHDHCLRGRSNLWDSYFILTE